MRLLLNTAFIYNALIHSQTEMKMNHYTKSVVEVKVLSYRKFGLEVLAQFIVWSIEIDDLVVITNSIAASPW